MPKSVSPTKQLPTGPPATPIGNGVSGNLLSQAIPVQAMKEDYINMVLYGANRVGKTTLACCFPKPLLIVSFEPGNTGGAASVKKVDGVRFLRIVSKAQSHQLATELRTDRYFKTHVLDTCTSLQEMLLKELMGLADLPPQLDWGTVPEEFYRQRSEQAKEVMKLYRDLPANTVFVAQERDHNPPRTTDSKGRSRPVNKLAREYMDTDLATKSYFAADMGAATVKWMHDACDYIGQLYVEDEVNVESIQVPGTDMSQEIVHKTGRRVRRLRTIYDGVHAAGFRSATPEAVPEYIEASSPQEMYAAMVEVIKGNKTTKGYYIP